MSGEHNGSIGSERLVHSTPGSPQERRINSFEVIGSAESLVGRVRCFFFIELKTSDLIILLSQQVLAEQGLGKYCDADFVRYTSREMQEALDMTSEEMDLAAHELLQQEHLKKPTSLGADSP